jgi:hypothetical protein
MPRGDEEIAAIWGVLEECSTQDAKVATLSFSKQGLIFGIFVTGVGRLIHIGG